MLLGPFFTSDSVPTPLDDARWTVETHNSHHRKGFKLNLFSQFARTLATLLKNGVPVLTALKITENVMPNTILAEAIAKTREDVTDGKTISQPLARSQVFP